MSDISCFITITNDVLPTKITKRIFQTDKGVRDVLQSDELFDCKPAIHRAFHFAKDKSTGDDKHGPDFLEFREFRLFLQTLRQYFEYFQAFDT